MVHSKPMNAQALHTETSPGAAGHNSAFTAGARASVGVAIGVTAFGLVFGILSRQAGLSLAESGLMSLFVFAGASQFVALDMWGPAMSISAVAFTALVVNLRHMLMGATASGWFHDCGRGRAMLTVFFMIDESWAMATAARLPMRHRAAFMLGSGLLLYLCWNLATLAGYLLVPEMDDPARWGLDFVFSAIFLALLAGMYRGKSDLPAWAVAALAAVVAAWLLPGKWYILVGGVAGGLLEAMRHGRNA